MALIIKPNIKQKPSVPAKPTYGQIAEEVAKLQKDSAPDQINNFLSEIAKAELDAVAESCLLSTIHKRSGAALKPLKQQLELFKKDLGLHSGDLALFLAREVLRICFQGGVLLVRCPDGSYWKNVGSHWVETTGDMIAGLIQKVATVTPLPVPNLDAVIGQAGRHLDRHLATDTDVMGLADDPAPIVNCANGEVWIAEDGNVDLRPHRPESRMTYCLPVEYSPEAKCPKFDAALLAIFANAENPEDMVRHILEFMGYVIQPRRDIATFWLLIGKGSNGKSKLLQTLQHLIGNQAVLNDQISSFQRDRFNVAALPGKLLFVDDDMAANTRLDDGLLKKISEAKEMSARHVRGRRKFKFRCLALPVMACNTFPTTSDTSHGLRRRAMVIPFDRIFGPGEADPSLFPTIWKSELPGILNRALEGLKRLRQRGDFKPPSDCMRAFEEFMVAANPLMAFLEEECEKDQGGWVYLRDFRKAMKAWAMDQGFKTPMPQNKLKHMLEGLGYKVTMKDGKNRVLGLKLKKAFLEL